jgi:nucleoside-triphosphatase
MPTRSGQQNILITGYPGVGKTTLIIKLAESLRASSPVGFYTEEIRERGIRKGFSLADFTGRRMVLSHVDIKSRDRVSKYGVDIPGFESFLDQLNLVDSSTPLIIIDEIGKMECLSQKFRGLIVDLLESPKRLLATIAMKGTPFIEEIKRRPDVDILEITTHNRGRLLDDIIEILV